MERKTSKPQKEQKAVKAVQASKTGRGVEVASSTPRPLRPVASGQGSEAKPSRPVKPGIAPKLSGPMKLVSTARPSSPGRSTPAATSSRPTKSASAAKPSKSSKPNPKRPSPRRKSGGKRSTTPSATLPAGVLKVYDALKYPFTHPGAFSDANGRAIRATTQTGFLVFGQYEKNFPAQDLVAVFSILVDNNTFDDAYVCTLDVVQDKSRVIAKSLLTRKDFPEAGKHVRFSLPFKPASTDSELEFRLLYMGYTYMAIKLICILDPAVLKVEDLPPDDVLLPPPPPPQVGHYLYDLKAVGTSLYNGSQKLTVLGYGSYMMKNMQTYPWPPYEGMTAEDHAKLLAKYNANLTRTFCIDTWTDSLYPWKRVGNKFDLNQFDPTYMANLRDLVIIRGNFGIIVQLDLFDNVALRTTASGMTWPRHPFNAANGGPISGSDGRSEFYNLNNSTVKALQEKYLRYMVSHLKDLKNIIFEVCNEYTGGTAWHNWVADVIKSENPNVLVSASCDINIPSDQIFKHRNIDITTSHTGDWVTRDVKTVNQSVLNKLKSYGKPTLLSTDGSDENYAAMKNDMYHTANLVIPQGFGLEFKDLYEPAADMIKPLGVPIQPAPSSGFCQGGELVCIDGFDPQKVQGVGGKVLGGQFTNGTFTPGDRGGIEFTFPLDTGKAYAVEFEIQNNIANLNGGKVDGGRVSLFDMSTPSYDSSKPDTYYGLGLQRMEGAYKGGGTFRSILAVRYDTEKYGILITSGDLAGAYDHKSWGPEPHRFRIEVRGDKYKLFIDANYTSRETIAPGPLIPGSKTIKFVLGNDIDQTPNRHAITQFTKFKVYYIK